MLQTILNDQILKGLKTLVKLLECNYLLLHCLVAESESPAIFCFCSGDLKSGGFSIDACRSMISLMDVSYVMFLLHLNVVI